MDFLLFMGQVTVPPPGGGGGLDKGGGGYNGALDPTVQGATPPDPSTCCYPRAERPASKSGAPGYCSKAQHPAAAPELSTALLLPKNTALCRCPGPLHPAAGARYPCDAPSTAPCSIQLSPQSTEAWVVENARVGGGEQRGCTGTTSVRGCACAHGRENGQRSAW